MNDLDRIFIRAKINDHWDTYSLAELVRLRQDEALLEWWNMKMSGIIDYKEGYAVTEEIAKKMIAVLEYLGETIYRTKGPKE